MKTERVIRSAALGLLINFSYSIYHAVLGFTSHSWWFITISVYYTVLSIMRFALLLMERHSRHDPAEAKFAERFTGFLLPALSFCFVGTVILSVVTDRGIRHHEIAMITIAVYTFTKMTLAVINLVKVKKLDLPIHRALRSISFADAFAAVYSLQRSMLVSFPGMAEKDIRLFNMLTGSGVCCIILLLGLYLIIGRKIKMEKFMKANEKIAETVTEGYKKVENTVVDGYKKMENAVVGGYTKVEDKFINAYLIREGETLEDAKARLKGEKKEEN